MRSVANDAHAFEPPPSVIAYIRDLLEQLEDLAIEEKELTLARQIAAAASTARRLEEARG